jgi:hypothetical protein
MSRHLQTNTGPQMIQMIVERIVHMHHLTVHIQEQIKITT